MARRREIYRSSNGDRWFLDRDSVDGMPVVVHEPNLPSGGKVSEVGIRSFLQSGDGPQQQSLLRMIGTLVDSTDKRPQKKAVSLTERAVGNDDFLE
jgi:hypothetical protein